MKKEALEEMIDTLEFSNKELEERKNECGDAICKAWYEGKIAANNDAIEVAKHLITINTSEDTTYYIEIEGQCSTVLALIKVKAENEDEAKLKALKALHATEDIYSVTQEEAQDLIDSGEVDYMLDEDGCEIDIDEED